MIRISEGQDLPDFLSNKDAGDFAGDMAFVTHNAASSKSHFFGDFATAVLNYHCVELLDLPLQWANYTSCSGGKPGIDTTCEGCVGGFDRGVAHNDCSAGPDLPPSSGLTRPQSRKGCNCTEEGKAYSLSHPGRMP